MYSIYVTNTSGSYVFVRVHHEKISAVNPRFRQELDKLSSGEAYRSYLVGTGFCMIPPRETMPFEVDVANDGTRKYLSLCATSGLWNLDFEVNCLRYGCVLVKGIETHNRSPRQTNVTFHLIPVNPEPRWIPKKVKDRLLSGEGIEVSPQSYFGRSSEDGTPCKVLVTGGEISNIWNIVHGYEENAVELLRHTSYEFVRAQAGDPVPPHAVIAGVSEPDGSLFLGRIGGSTLCSVSTSDGKIKYFYYRLWASQQKKIQSVEILILKNPAYPLDNGWKSIVKK